MVRRPQSGDKQNHDNDPKGSLIEAYWKDNHTGGAFKKIGSQRIGRMRCSFAWVGGVHDFGHVVIVQRLGMTVNRVTPTALRRAD